MSIEKIERTSIWKKTLAPKAKDEYKIERDLLKNIFLGFRKNATYLVSRISASFPELTQHEVSHLDTLWETASLITGDKFPLTPLEGFVLGGAFLLHDSALCFEAYENGKVGLRETIQWKDAFADLRDSDPLKSIEEIEHKADFTAIRNLHAYQAENLLSRKWTDSSTRNEIYLLENQELRNHLGKIIGQIASSHHWDIETVISVLPAQQNAPTGFPTEWRIDPIKIACILRCADAAHIDNERAPDFLHALLKRSGVSFNHWKAQNRLSQVDIDQNDPKKNTLIYTSTIDFKESDADAWFVAYDAVCLIDKEIKSCNSVLENRLCDTFQVKKVKGAESPEILSNYIRACGWKPCSAKVHIGNVEKIIQNLGGEMLYGTGSDALEIVLRELIQNARDSIVAREAFDKSFEGKITVKITKDINSLWVIIADNGIGMSERVLTGPLLDFGTSFWASSLVQSEFPGLRSSKFKSIGKFGIGFYSIFMVAEQVIIATRMWDAGLVDVKQLKFPKGFTLNPILSKERPSDFISSTTTQIKFKIKDDILPENLLIEIKNNIIGVSNFEAPFEKYLATLCAGLDMPVYYKEFDKNEVLIHENINSNHFDKKKWLEDISFANSVFEPIEVSKNILKNVDRLKPIIENDKILGLAAINYSSQVLSQGCLNIATVGGLAFSVHLTYRHREYFIGFLDYTAKSAKRDPGRFSASDIAINKWGEEQLKELIGLNLTPLEKYFASSSLCYFNIDPSPIVEIPIVYKNEIKFFSIENISELSTEVGIAFLNSNLGHGHMEVYHDIQELNGYALIKVLTHGPFLSLKLNNGKPENNNSILDCIYRGITKKGYTPSLTTLNEIGFNNFGQKMSVLVLTSNR